MLKILENACEAPLFSVFLFSNDYSTALQDKYINPFTDFGFKKLFGSELKLPYLQYRPQALQERVFQKLFEAAEIAKFTPDEKNKYEESLKYYRDLKNVVDNSFDEGKEERNIEIARQMKSEGEPLEKIVRFIWSHFGGNRTAIIYRTPPQILHAKFY